MGKKKNRPKKAAHENGEFGKGGSREDEQLKKGSEKKTNESKTHIAGRKGRRGNNLLRKAGTKGEVWNVRKGGEQIHESSLTC